MKRFLTFLLLGLLSWSVNSQEELLIPVSGSNYFDCGNPYRNNPSFTDGRHTGVDYCSNNSGTITIRAAASGTVGFTQQMFGYGTSDGCGSAGDHGMGNNVIIRHAMANGSYMYTSYSHLDEISVSVGDIVYQGQIIGEMGRSGYGSSSYWDDKHVHFETRIDHFACNLPGSDLDGDLHWGYVSPNEEPDDHGYVNPTLYLEGTNNGAAAYVTTTPVPVLPLEDQTIDFFAGEINFDFGTVANAEEYRIQVIKIDNATPVWTPENGFTASTSCNSSIVINTNTGNTSGLSWNQDAVNEGYACQIPLEGEQYAFTVRSYNSQNFVSPYSVPRFFYILPNGCQETNFTQSSEATNSCINLRVIEEDVASTVVANNGIIEFDFTQELLGDGSSNINSTAAAYLSESPTSYSSSDMVASFSATLSDANQCATHTQLVNAPSEEGEYYLHMVVDPYNDHDEFLEGEDNDAVIGITISQSATAGCFPVENFRLGGIDPVNGRQLLWDASPTGDFYDLFVRQVGGTAWSVITPSFDDPTWYAFYQGEPGLTYETFVRTTCFDGNFADSPTLQFTMPGDPCVLNGLMTYNLDYNSTWVQWDALGPNSTYTITLLDENGTELDNNFTSNTTTYFGNLTPSTYYTIEVRGQCPSGTMLVTASVDFVTDSYDCGPITNLSGEATAIEATFTWDEAAGNVYEYEYTYVRSNGTSGSGETFGTTVSISLSEGQTIDFTLIADCGATASSDPATISVTAPPLTCHAVQNLALVSTTSSGLSFSWAAEDEAYYYNYRLSANGNIVEEGSWESTFIVFPGLSSSTIYTFEVAPICNEAGPYTSLNATTQPAGSGNDNEFTLIIDAHPTSTHISGLAVNGDEICAVGSDFIYQVSTEGEFQNARELTFDQGTVKLERVIATSDGNYAAVGDVQFSGSNNDTPCLLKFTPAGDILFAKYLAGGSNDDEAEDLIEDSAGNYIITGGHRSFSATGRDLFVIKLSSSGGLVFQKAFGYNSHDRGFGIKEANSGGYYIAGRGLDPDSPISTNDGMPVLKLDNNGNVIWSKLFLSTTDDIEARDIAIDDNDNLYFVGEKRFSALGQPTVSTVIFGKINPSGTVQFAKTVTGPEAGDDLFGIAIDGNNAFLTGRSYVDGDQRFTMHHFNTTGSHLNSSYIAGNDNIFSNDIVTDGQYIYAGGLSETFTNNSSNNAILVKRSMDLGSDCFSFSFTPQVDNVALQSQGFQTTIAPSYTVANAGIISALATVEVIDLCGVVCPEVSATVNQNIGCVGTDFFTTFTGSGADEIQWTADDGSSATGTTASFNFSSAGTYTITVIASNADCSESYSLEVEVLTDPAVTYTTVNPNCPGANTGLIEVQTAPSNSISWNTGETTPVISDLLGGSYTVTVTSSAGCATVESITLEDEGSLPTASFTHTPTGNRSYSFTSTSSDATLLTWSFGDGTTATGSNVTHNYASGGQYTVVLSATNNCGTVEATETITLVCSDPMILASSSDACPQQTITFSASGTDGATIEWRVMETGELATTDEFITSFSEAGSYTILLRAITDNCTISTATIITIHTSPVVALNIVHPNCPDSYDGSILANIQGISPFSYSWSNGENTGELTDLGIGSYSVTVTDDYGCSGGSSGVLTALEQNPVAGFSYDIDGLEVVFTDNSSASDTYNWDFGDGNTATGPSPAHTYTTDGTYDVTLSVGNDCGSDFILQQLQLDVDDGSPFGTVTPTNLYGVFWGQAQIDGVNAVAGDWVAAYDESGVLAGAGPLVIANGIAYLNVTIFGDDPNTSIDEGINPGEAFTLVLYDASENQYLSYPTAEDPVLFTEWQSTNGAAIPAYSDYEEVYNWLTTCTDVLSLISGWNLISLDVAPTDSSVVVIFGELISNGSLLTISTLTETGSLFYQPGIPFSTLTHLERGKGYWVKVASDQTLSVNGPCVSPDYRYPLTPGWNMVGFIPADPIDVTVYFATEIANGTLEFVTGFDPTTGSGFYSPNYPPFLNTLSVLENGYGYFVKLITTQPLVGDHQWPHAENQEPKSSIYSNFTADLNNWIGRSSASSFSLRDSQGRMLSQMSLSQNGWLEPTTLYGEKSEEPGTSGIEVGTLLYLYADEKPISKPIKFDGQPLVHKIVLADGITEDGLFLYPNPAKQVVHMQLGHCFTQGETAQVWIVDQYGRVMWGKATTDSQLSIPIDSWPSGTYAARVISNVSCSTATKFFVVVE